MFALFAVALLGFRVAQNGVLLAVVEEVVHDLEFKIIALVIGKDNDIAFILHVFAPRKKYFTATIVPQMRALSKEKFPPAVFFHKKPIIFERGAPQGHFALHFGADTV